MNTLKLAGIPPSGPNPFQGLDRQELLDLIKTLSEESLNNCTKVNQD